MSMFDDSHNKMSCFQPSAPIAVKQKSPPTNPFLTTEQDFNQCETLFQQSSSSNDFVIHAKSPSGPFEDYVLSLDANSELEEEDFNDQNQYETLDFESNSADSLKNSGSIEKERSVSQSSWYIGDTSQQIKNDFNKSIPEDSNKETIPTSTTTDEENNKPDINKKSSSKLAFDTSSSESLIYFLKQSNTQNLQASQTSNFYLSSSVSSLQSSQNSLHKSNSSASFFETSQQSPSNASVLSSSASSNNIGTMMSVASKKRGLFSRSSKQSAGNSHIGSSTSINDHHEENGKLKSTTPSSPSGTSHHMNELDEDRFNGDGVMFQGKLIGHEYVAEARGEQMCQQSLKKLKIIQKALGGHKRKVNMFVSFDGIKIQDPNTQEELFHHTVPQISFISRDETDTRAFGYVFGNSQTGHQFIGIKTKKEAMVVMSTIGQLFAITLKRKRSAEEAAAAAAAQSSSNTSANQLSSALTSTPASSTLDTEEHLYHSVVDQTSTTTHDDPQLSTTNATSSKSTIRARLRHNTGTLGSLENVPIPALPPPSEHHGHQRHHHHHRQQLLNNHNNSAGRFATVGRAGGQDFNNNSFNNQQNKLQSASSLINELDLFQPTAATGQNLAASFDASLQSKDQKANNPPSNRLAASCDWAQFDDDPLPSTGYQQGHDNDSTLNTISSISDTLTTPNNNTLTMNQSVTLVAGANNTTTGKFGTNANVPITSKAVSNIQQQKPLNSSSTTISSANFDGMDPFSDAFGAGDDPFSTASTTADISSNVFSAKVPITSSQTQNRPPSNPGPQSVFDSNKLNHGFKNQESHGSVPALANSFGSLSFDQGNSNNFNKSSVELRNNQTASAADKYAVLADINSISTSIFDSLGGNRPDSQASTKDMQREKQNTPTPPPNFQQLQQQRSSFQSGLANTTQCPYPQQQVPQLTQQMASGTANFGNSFCNVSYQQQQQQKPISYGANGVVVLPPVSNSNTGFKADFSAFGNTSQMPQQQPQSNPATQNLKNQWTTKSFDEVPNKTANFANFPSSSQSQQQQAQLPRQPPRAEFDSMSNLSSASSNASNGGTNTPKKSTTETKTEIPLFQELDPLNKNRPSYSPSNFIVQEKNRSSPLAGNPILDSSLSSINSSNSSLFNNSRNCSTPNSLNRKSPQPQHQLQMQYSLPTSAIISSATTSVSKLQSTSIPPVTSATSDFTKMTSVSSSIASKSAISTVTTSTTTTATISPSPHYIMLYHLNSMPAKNQDTLKTDEKNMEESATDSKTKDTEIKEQTEDGENEEKSKGESELENDFGDKHKHRSRTSSISSSSNSLLINQSNFSELKFDDVFEAPLLAPSSLQDNSSSPIRSNSNLDSQQNQDNTQEPTTNSSQIPQSSDDTKPQKSSTIEQSKPTLSSQHSHRLKSADSVSSLKSDSGLVPIIGHKQSISQSSVTSVPAPVNRSLSRQSSNASTSSSPAIPPRTDLQHSRSNHASATPPQYQVPPPPLPPPLHHAHYGGGRQQMPPMHYPLPPPPPHPYAQPPPYYHHYYQDLYARVPPPPHRPYWNSTYDWPPTSESIYGTISGRMPLDYPPPPIPGTAFHEHPYYNSSQAGSSTSRPYSGGGVSVSSSGSCSWHDYYQMSAQQQPQQSCSSPSPGSIYNINQQQTPQADVTVANNKQQNMSSSSRSTTPPTTVSMANVAAPTSSTSMSGTPPPAPQLPNPQRRISSTSNISVLSETNQKTVTTQQSSAVTASQLQRTASNVSSSSSIPTYPPPPVPIPHDISSYYAHHYSQPPPPPAFYDDNSGKIAPQGPSPFAAFNMNMEQMIMKYHQPPPPPMPPTGAHHRASPIYSEYSVPSGPSGSPYGPAHPMMHASPYPSQYRTPPPPSMATYRGRPYSNNPQQPQMMLDAAGGQISPYASNNNNNGCNSNSSSSGYYSSSSVAYGTVTTAGQQQQQQPASTNVGQMMMDGGMISPWTSSSNDKTPQQQQQDLLMECAWNENNNSNSNSKEINNDVSKSEASKTSNDNNLFDDNFASFSCFEQNQPSTTSTTNNDPAMINDGFDTVKRNNKVSEQSEVVNGANDKQTVDNGQLTNETKQNETLTESNKTGNGDNTNGDDGQALQTLSSLPSPSVTANESTPKTENQDDNSNGEVTGPDATSNADGSTPEERNIFANKDDPFEDDFFKS